MPYTRRRFSGGILSLLHFDFPYYGEPEDGLRDEASLEKWTRHGTVRLVGTETPNDAVVSGTPKFGYRCLQGTGNTNDYVSGTNITGQWNMDMSKVYEIECFVRVTSSAEGYVFMLVGEGGSSLLTLGKNTSNQLYLVGAASGTSSSMLTVNVWQHVLVRITGGHGYIFVDGTQVLDVTLSAGQVLGVAEVRLGGFAGQMDEFVFRNDVTPGTVPEAPYQGAVDIQKVSYIYGKDGTDLVAPTYGFIWNMYGRVKSVQGRVITTEWRNNNVPLLYSVVMLHVTEKQKTDESLLGCYAFRQIVGVNGTTLTLDRDVTEEFSLAQAVQGYVVQIVQYNAPKTLTVPTGAIWYCPNYRTEGYGGIVILSSYGDMTINGIVTSTGYGPHRTDMQQFTNAGLIDRFIVGGGGGVFILCGGTLRCGAEARIGAQWSGSGKGGVPVRGGAGGHGGAGYGGAGGGDSDNKGTGGAGGVGGGGGGSDIYSGQAAGAGGRTGGRSGYSSLIGGAQGVSVGAESAQGHDTGGGGAGGCAGNSDVDNLAGGCSGASVIILAKRIAIPEGVISTGGEGGHSLRTGTGGGGSGFCFIAAEEVL